LTHHERSSVASGSCPARLQAAWGDDSGQVVAVLPGGACGPSGSQSHQARDSSNTWRSLGLRSWAAPTTRGSQFRARSRLTANTKRKPGPWAQTAGEGLQRLPAASPEAQLRQRPRPAIVRALLQAHLMQLARRGGKSVPSAGRGDVQGDVFRRWHAGGEMGQSFVEEGVNRKGLHLPDCSHSCCSTAKGSQTMPVRGSIVPRTVTSSR